MRRLAIGLVLVSAVLVAAFALSRGGGSPPGRPPEPAAGSLADARRELRGAPAPLAALHAQAGRLLGGRPRDFDRRLAELRGYPVVVNKWASWCGPCRAEYPHFQSQARRRGKEIAFLGVDTLDNDAAARRFLAEYPVPYPHYRDPDGTVGRDLRRAAGLPATAFYDRRGRLVTLKQGGYATEADLAADIRRYAR